MFLKYCILNHMKIKLSELRRIIRSVLMEQAVVPGKWDPVTGEPVKPDDIELMGTGGLGHGDHKDEDAAALDEKKGLWANIWARRRAGKSPKRRGDKGYPKTLDIEESDSANTNE